MKRTHPLFNVRKEASTSKATKEASQQRKTGETAKKKSQGFSGSPMDQLSYRNSGNEELSKDSSTVNQVNRNAIPLSLEDKEDETEAEGKSSCIIITEGARPKLVLLRPPKAIKSSSKGIPNTNYQRSDFIRVEMPSMTNPPGVPVPTVVTPMEKEGCWNKLTRRSRAAWILLLRMWMAFIKWKRRWDLWDPNPNHPIVACIRESKLAGLKEAIKPNRGIFYRSNIFF